MVWTWILGVLCVGFACLAFYFFKLAGDAWFLYSATEESKESLEKELVASRAFVSHLREDHKRAIAVERAQVKEIVERARSIRVDRVGPRYVVSVNVCPDMWDYHFLTSEGKNIVAEMIGNDVAAEISRTRFPIPLNGRY